MRCSQESARAFILRPTPSRRLVVWLVASHAAALAGAWALPVGVGARIVLLSAIVAHALWRRPRAAGRLVAAADGTWSLPDRGVVALRVAPASTVGAAWIRLRLQGAGRPVTVLLGRDQLSASAWRRLHVRVRQDLSSTHLS